MNRLYLTMMMCAASFISFAEDAGIRQEEVYLIVVDEVLSSMHPHDAQASIDYLKSKGISDYVIAEALSRSLRRDMNSRREEAGSERANAAIHWLEVLGDQNQISNLLYVAQVSTNAHAATAVRAYYRKLGDKGRFIDCAGLLLGRSGMEQLKASVWDCLEAEAKEPGRREQVLAVANGQLRNGFINLFYADRILSKWQIGYAKSTMRKKLLISAAEDSVAQIAFPMAHDMLLKRLNEEVLK